MDRAFVDSSGWIAGASSYEPKHKAVKSAILHWKGRMVTSNFVINETITFLSYDIGHSIAVRVGDNLRNSTSASVIRITQDDEDAAFELLRRRPDQKYSFTDCTSFVLMKRLGIKTAISLDADFRREGFQTIP